VALFLLTVTEKTPANINRTERVIAYMIVSTIALTIVALIAIIIGAGTGVDASSGIWPAITILPMIGLPAAIVLIIALVVSSAVRRARAARDGNQ
jgi:hypothetical protein